MFMAKGTSSWLAKINLFEMLSKALAVKQSH